MLKVKFVKQENFASSLKSILILMRIFGLQLDILSPPQSFLFKVAQYVLSFFAILMFLAGWINFITRGLGYYFNFGLYTAFLVDVYWTFANISKEIGDEIVRHNLMLCFRLDYRLLLILLSPSILAFHLFLTGRWKNLWLTVIKIEEEMQLSNTFFRICRNRCCYLVLCVLFLVM